jgi:hypothetical protein
MLKYHRVNVHIKDSQITQVDIPEWEVPVLRLVHNKGEGSIDPITLIEVRNVDREPPEANDEYERLKNRYKRIEDDDGKKGEYFVAIIYGKFGVGQQNIAKAISAAVTDGKATVDDLVGDMGQAQVA